MLALVEALVSSSVEAGASTKASFSFSVLIVVWASDAKRSSVLVYAAKQRPLILTCAGKYCNPVNLLCTADAPVASALVYRHTAPTRSLSWPKHTTHSDHAPFHGEALVVHVPLKTLTKATIPFWLFPSS